jgi:hypothetical protein
MNSTSSVRFAILNIIALRDKRLRKLEVFEYQHSFLNYAYKTFKISGSSNRISRVYLAVLHVVFPTFITLSDQSTSKHPSISHPIGRNRLIDISCGT